MNTTSRIITGSILILLGLYITIISLLGIDKELWGLIYGIIILITGIFLIFNKKEDEIEKIRSKK